MVKAHILVGSQWRSKLGPAEFHLLSRFVSYWLKSPESNPQDCELSQMVFKAEWLKYGVELH